MNIKVSKIMNTIGYRELISGFHELEQMNKTGELVDGVCREYFEKIYPHYKEEHVPLFTIVNIWYEEMAKRYISIMK